MKGILLVRNQREQLMPLTALASPPMLNFFDRPLIDISLKLFQKHGISKVSILSEEELPDMREYLSRQPFEELETEYITAPNKAVSLNLLTQTDDPCLILCQLAVTDIDVTKALRFHHSHTNPITVVMPATQPEECNPFDTTVEALPKEKTKEEVCCIVNTPSLCTLDFSIKDPIGLEFPKETPVSVFYAEGYYEIISSPEDYLRILKESLDNKWLMSPYHTGNGVFLNANTFLEVGAKIKPPVYIGENVSIEKNAEILPYSIICRHSHVCENAKISDSLLMEKCHIEKNASVSGSLLGEGCTIGEGLEISTGSRYGAYTKLCPNASEKSLPKTSPQPSVEFSFSENPFPVPKENPHQFLFTLGTACRPVFEKGIIGIFRDDSALAELYLHSLHAGIQSAGISLYEFPECSFAMCKSACPFYHLNAGFYLFESNQQLWVAILEETGYALSCEKEKAMETALKNITPAAQDIPLHKTTVVKPYQMYYYTEMIRKAGNETAECYLTADTHSPIILQYLQKLASCHRITLLYEKRPGIIVFQSNGSGRDVTIYDENSHPLTKRQVEAIIASLMIAEQETSFVVTPLTPEVTRQTLTKHGFQLLETESHPHIYDRMLAKNPLQYALTYDPVFLMIKMLLYLSKNKLTLTQWVSTLPKAFFIEKTLTAGEQLADALQKLIELAKNNDKEKQKHYKIKSKKGITVVTPEKDCLRIVSESDREEYAKELTDFYVFQCLTKEKENPEITDRF